MGPLQKVPPRPPARSLILLHNSMEQTPNDPISGLRPIASTRIRSSIGRRHGSIPSLLQLTEQLDRGGAVLIGKRLQATGRIDRYRTQELGELTLGSGI